MEANNCKSCGRPLTVSMYRDLKGSITDGNKEHKKIFDKHKIDTYCCRVVLLTSINIMDYLPFYK